MGHCFPFDILKCQAYSLLMPATQTAAVARKFATDRRWFLTALRNGKPSIGFGPQCLVLGRVPSADLLALCEAIEAIDPISPDLFSPVQFRAEIARCAKRHGATAPDLHVRLTDAIANARHEDAAIVAALILAAVPA
jgi:hypothetical protein